MIRRLTTAAALAIAVLGTGAAEARPLEKAERVALARYIKAIAKDPDSIRQVSISERFGDGGSLVCVAMNAKNSYGGYTGVQAAAYFVPYKGVLPADKFSHLDHNCRGLRFGPFPELAR